MDYRKMIADSVARMEMILTAAKNENRVPTQAEQDEIVLLEGKIKSGQDAIESEARIAKLKEPVNTPPVPDVRVVNEKKFKHAGEFLDCIKKAGMPNGVVDNRLNAAGMNVAVGSEGGFLVEPEFSRDWIKGAFEVGILASRIPQPVPVSGNTLTIPAVVETSRVSGSRWGGVSSAWVGEGVAIGASTPTVGQIELKLKKLAGLAYMTDELLADSFAAATIMGRAFSEDIAWNIDSAIFSGNGVNQPLGFTNSPALVTIAKEGGQAAATIVYQNLLKMWSRMPYANRQSAVWLINQNCEYELGTMAFPIGAGGVPVYLPAGGISGQPYSTLFGRPVLPIEQAEALGSVGDIMFVDPQQYVSISKGNIETAVSMHLRFNFAEQAFRYVLRMDGAPTWKSSVAPAKGTGNVSPYIALAVRA